MKTVTVTASGSYDVIIGAGLLRELKTSISQVTKAETFCIVSDDTVWSIYGQKVLEVLSDRRCISFVFPAGEKSKNAATYIRLLEYLAENHVTRSDCLIALGGGVVGDLTGFAAATYLRGIDFVQIPTTLLAAVDSSVGGKTAIDLEAGKNLAGAFYQPKLVLCDTELLNTLPVDIFRDGCAEVIKYGILYDQELFDTLLEAGMEFDKESVITRCVELKRDVVAGDEFDRGQRQKLNLGHTLGHGIEAGTNFDISHGKAVAIGMAMAARIAAENGLCDKTVSSQILAALQRFALPTESPVTVDTILLHALSDKKRHGNKINLILPRTIGNCDIIPTAVEELKSYIEAGY